MELLIVTSKSCGACKKFKANVLEDLLKRLAKTGCKTKQIELENFSTGELVNLAPEIPATVQSYISWFPTLLLFSSGYQGVPKVFNGKVKEGSVEYVQEKPFTAEAITSWVEENSISKKGETEKKIRYVLVKDGKPLTKSRFIRRNY